jgi:hypothetical protein
MVLSSALLQVPNYMTLWAIVLVLAHRVSHRVVDLLLLTWIVAWVSTYLIFVRPGYFQLVLAWSRNPAKERDIIYTDDGSIIAMVAHVALHVLPLLFVAHVYGRFYVVSHPLGAPSLIAAVLFLVYARAVKFEEVYDVDFSTIALVGSAAGLCYAVLVGSAAAL